MSGILVNADRIGGSTSAAFRIASGILVGYLLIATLLLLTGRHDYPGLHAVLDTGDSLSSAVLAALLWDMGRRTDRPLPIWLSIGFAVTSLLELVHVLVIVDWTGSLGFIADSAHILRPKTWPPAAHVLPIAVAGSLWLLRSGRQHAGGFTLAMIAAAAALFEVFQGLPTYTPPTFLGITRPALILAPALWLVVGAVCWRWRAVDRMLQPLALMSVPLLLANLVMLYSQSPHDAPAMAAHLGKMMGYLTLQLALMRLASFDMLERVRAERQLAQINESLEARVRDRTAELGSANAALNAEIVVRRNTEQKSQAQLERLNLLHHITRAIGERQDLGSIFQVVVRSLENQLPIDLCCVCLYDETSARLTVSKVGVKSAELALSLAMLEHAHVPIDENGLSQCVHGKLVYEPDLELADFPFPRRLFRGGLRSLVIAPLQVESRVFGVLVTARREAHAFSSGDCEFLRQLSEHVAIAAHQGQLHEALQQAYDDLRQTQQVMLQQERLRALGQMASGIGHDINNALTPISFYAETLLETETNLSKRAGEYIATILRAVDDIAHTVGRMKEFYRQRESELPLQPMQLNQLIPQAIDLTRARWSDIALQRGATIALESDLATNLPPVAGLESEIREALINLIFNAVDAMPAGGTLTLRTKASHRAGDAQPDSVRLEVADTGVGMDDDTRQRCLEPFFTTKGERGTGLGLAMVYGVMRRHGADIEIHSRPGHGTTFVLIFPMMVSAASAVATTQRMVVPARLRLLVVDDDPLLLKSLREILETDGHTVISASDGQAGIDLFRAARERGESFSAVITDLGMPHIDGRRVASAIKASVPNMPVIMLTGWGQRLITEHDIPPHVDRVLSKPPKLRDLRQALAELCAADPGP